MAKRRLIPFNLCPGSWGLTGRVYEEAEANYYYEGEELERKLVAIHHKNDPAAIERGLLALDLKYGKVTTFEHDMRLLSIGGATINAQQRAKVEYDHGKLSKYEYDRKVAMLDTAEGSLARDLALLEVDLANDKISLYEFEKNKIKLTSIEGDDLDVALLEIEYKHHKIEENEFLKRKATILQEPWVGIVKHGYDPNAGVEGFYFELDWNSYWADYLRLNGYVGTDGQIVEAWFADVSNGNLPDEIMDVQMNRRSDRGYHS